MITTSESLPYRDPSPKLCVFMLTPSISLLGLAQTAIVPVPTRPTAWTPPGHVLNVKMWNVWYVTSPSATGVKQASIWWVMGNVVYLWSRECVWDGKWPSWLCVFRWTLCGRLWRRFLRRSGVPGLWALSRRLPYLRRTTIWWLRLLQGGLKAEGWGVLRRKTINSMPWETLCQQYVKTLPRCPNQFASRVFHQMSQCNELNFASNEQTCTLFSLRDSVLITFCMLAVWHKWFPSLIHLSLCLFCPA